MLLCRRVRAAAATMATQTLRRHSGCAGESAIRSLGIRVPQAVCEEARMWFSGVASYVVRPLWVFPPVYGALQQVLRTRGLNDQPTILRITTAVCRCLGTYGRARLPTHAYDVCRLSSCELITVRRRVRKATDALGWSPRHATRHECTHRRTGPHGW